jgi:hypothetical protein
METRASRVKTLVKAEEKEPVQTSHEISPVVAKKADHIDDVEGQNDGGSTDQNEVMYAVASQC